MSAEDHGTRQSNLNKSNLAEAFPDAAHRPSARDIPSLDGLRALSITFVILGHATNGHTSALIERLFGRLAQFGVCVFFVISGYLITTLIQREAERSGSISLPRFYLRRTLRIFPPFYVFLLVVYLLGLHGSWSIPPGVRWWPALTYLSNIFDTHYRLIGHTWSLSIEEQFYFTWPFILAMLVRKNGSMEGFARAAGIALGALALMPALRVAVFAFSRSGPVVTGLLFDYVAAGSAIALCESSNEADGRGARLRAVIASRIPPSFFCLAIVLHLIFAIATRWIFAIDMVVVTPVEAILLALFVAWAVRNPQHLIGRFLNLRPLRIVGVGSYSLYLWQQIFLVNGTPVSTEWTIGMKLMDAGVLAAASYWAVERPSLFFRARLEQRLFSTVP